MNPEILGGTNQPQQARGIKREQKKGKGVNKIRWTLSHLYHMPFGVLQAESIR